MEVLEEVDFNSDFSLQDSENFGNPITLREQDLVRTTVYLPAEQDHLGQLLIAQAGKQPCLAHDSRRAPWSLSTAFRLCLRV